MAILKGVLEADAGITLLAGVSTGGWGNTQGIGDPLARVFEIAHTPEVREIMRRNGVEVISGEEASRGIMLAAQVMRGKSPGLWGGMTPDASVKSDRTTEGREHSDCGSAIVLIPNSYLGGAIIALNRVCADRKSSTDEECGSMCIIMEDDPGANPCMDARSVAIRLRLPTLEAGEVNGLRRGIDHALRLSSISRKPAALIVHRSILLQSDMVTLRPNRALEPGQVIVQMRSRSRGGRRFQPLETIPLQKGIRDEVLRMARRIELNQQDALPSPGERTPLGFIVLGPAIEPLFSILGKQQLRGRIPVLTLGLLHPLDETAMARMLMRCDHVVVLEPRPGTMENIVLSLAEQLRKEGKKPGAIWGGMFPSPPMGEATDTPLSHTPDDSSPSTSQRGRDTSGNRMHQFGIQSDQDLHPSILNYKITHLLRWLHPSIEIHPAMDQPSMTPAESSSITSSRSFGDGFGPKAARAELQRILEQVDDWLKNRPVNEETVQHVPRLILEGFTTPHSAHTPVQVEFYEEDEITTLGLPAIRQAALSKRSWIFLIREGKRWLLTDLERLIKGVIPGERVERVEFMTANFAHHLNLRDVLRQAALRQGVTIVLVGDGPPARYDSQGIEEDMVETDELGFRSKKQIILPADTPCDIQISGAPFQVVGGEEVMQPGIKMDRLSPRAHHPLMIRLRLQWEQIIATRSRPPISTLIRLGQSQNKRKSWEMRFPDPETRHGKQGHWRVHLAGCRGGGSGIAASILSRAGLRMGYAVRICHSPTPVRHGLKAWTQILFTRADSDQKAPTLTSRIPYGEADLLLGVEPEELMRSMGMDTQHRVFGEDHTCLVANFGMLSDRSAGEVNPVCEEMQSLDSGPNILIDDFAAVCHTWFHSCRVLDVMILGVAYQFGAVPVSRDALESAVHEQELLGTGQVRAAFQLGRALVADPGRIRFTGEDKEDSPERTLRRLALILRRTRWVGDQTAGEFQRLGRQMLDDMPGLAETDPGRAARRACILALSRCVRWGGIGYAEQYADLVERVYRIDRGDRGRALTRTVILPLAESMLIRDAPYLAAMTISPEYRRRLRALLNVKKGRGDRVERSFLTRLEIVFRRIRFRADVRTGAGSIRAMARWGRLLPQSWRGSPRERLLRKRMLEFIEGVIQSPESEYDQIASVLSRLHELATEGRLRNLPLSEFDALVGIKNPDYPDFPIEE